MTERTIKTMPARVLLTVLAVLTATAAAAQGEDKTSLIRNASFESGLTGWTASGLQSQSNADFAKKSGTYYVEKWVSKGNYAGNASVRQTLTGLPFGTYRLTAAAQNLNQNSTSARCSGAAIFAGSEQTAVYTPDDYSVTFTTVTGEVTIGFEAVGATGNWLALDNFRLTLLNTIGRDEVMAEVARLVAVAEGLDIPSEIAATYERSDALAAAIAAAQALGETSTDAEVSAAMKDLERATDAERMLIEKALLAWHIANPGDPVGTAPRVTETNHYVAAGATQALVRAAMTGSNIMERGVCWSTHREPTVLDDRTTKAYQQKGYVFHIEGLTPATVYYMRPYVMTRAYQVAYGDEVKFVTIRKGTCTWSWDNGSPDAAANDRCRNAMEETIEYFNEWTGIRGFHLSGHYGAQTPTADCSYGGWMRIGPNAGNQAIGTVLHETGHGVGVGTHWRWNNCSDTRENTTHGYWLGREANNVLRFLENCDNQAVVFTGDGVHGWGTIKPNSGSVPNGSITFDWLVNGADKDKHDPYQYIGGMCILRGLFIDGLCPTTGYNNGVSGYTYNFDDQKKYYLMNKSTDGGLGEGLLFQRNSTSLGWKRNLGGEAVSDSAAWYLEYSPTAEYYAFRNAATGRYLSHTSTAVTLKNVTKATASEYFQLMPDRTDVYIGQGAQRFRTHGYWLTWDDSGARAMAANRFIDVIGYGTVARTDFSYSNAATSQQWVIISEDELERYREVYIASAIREVAPAAPSAADAAVYDLQGRRVDGKARGIYIVGGKKVVKR